MLGMRRPEYIRYTQPEPLARLTHHFFMGGGPPGFFFICGGPPFFGGPFFAGGPFLGGPCTRTHTHDLSVPCPSVLNLGRFDHIWATFKGILAGGISCAALRV